MGHGPSAVCDIEGIIRVKLLVLRWPLGSYCLPWREATVRVILDAVVIVSRNRRRYWDMILQQQYVPYLELEWVTWRSQDKALSNTRRSKNTRPVGMRACVAGWWVDGWVRAFEAERCICLSWETVTLVNATNSTMRQVLVVYTWYLVTHDTAVAHPLGRVFWTIFFTRYRVV